MRKVGLSAALVTATLGWSTAGSAVAQAPANAGRALFISPMGEPFRGPSAKLMLRQWFDAADSNHDGSLAAAEMRSDAARVFKLLNRNGDSEIDPTELAIYEIQVVPEVRVGATVIDRGSSSYGGPDAAQTADSQTKRLKQAAPRQGAGRFGLLATPNPVASADINFNRGISADEFTRAARVRFGLLDANHDGRLAFDELPALPSRGWR